VQLGYAPRMAIEHTSAEEIGQIYVPSVNWALMVATVSLVVVFGRSSRLAAAYGIAVTGTMATTTVLAFFVTRERWGWSLPAALAVTGVFLTADLAFLSANFVKVADGGWVPLAIGAVVYTLMATWKRGRELLEQRLAAMAVPFEGLLQEIAQSKPHVVTKPAVYLVANPDATPPALVRNLRHNNVMHELVVMISIVTEEEPYVSGPARLAVTHPAPGFVRVIARYGFMQAPNVPEIVGRLNDTGLDLPPEEITFFLGRETVIATSLPGMALWRERLFAFMSRNATRAAAYFRIPSKRVFEVGAQVDL